MMSNQRSGWRTEWVEFVRDVAEDIRNGVSDTVLENKYCGRPVQWTGTVVDTEFGIAPVVRVNMTPVRVEMISGQLATVDYLGLNIPNNEVTTWNAATVGKKIRFQTTIRKTTGPFVGLRWVDLGQGTGYLQISTENSVLLGIDE